MPNSYTYAAINRKPYHDCVCFATFADTRLSAALNAITAEAWNLDIFDQIFAYNENTLGEDFWAKHGNFIRANRRGFGYWIWKQFVIDKTLKQIPENCFLIYADAGFHIVSSDSGRNRTFEYIAKLKSNKKHVLAFEIFQIEKHWNKKDLTVFINATEQMLNLSQIQGGLVLVRNSPEGRGLIHNWLTVMESDYDLINDRPSKIPNDPSFKEHRHDQSVFSLLMESLPEVALIMKPRGAHQDPFHTQRDKSKNRKSPPPASHIIALKRAFDRLATYV